MTADKMMYKPKWINNTAKALIPKIKVSMFASNNTIYLPLKQICSKI